MKIRRRTAAGTGLAEWLPFLLTVGYLAVWIPQGLDMTDEGYHLSMQRQWLRGDPLPTHGRMLWLTAAAGGCWLQSTAPLGLLGARLGWVFVLAFTAGMAAWILRVYLGSHEARWSALLTTIILTHHGNMVINQNNVPFLMTLLAGGCLLAADRSVSVSWAIFAGCLLGLAIHCRLPLALIALVLPLLPPLVRLRETSSSVRSRRWHCTLAGLAAVVLTAGLLALIRPSEARSIGPPLLTRTGELAEDYGGTRLLRLYGLDGLRALRLLLAVLTRWVPWAVGAHWILARLKRPHLAPPLLALAILAWTAFSIRAHGIGAFHDEYFRLMPALALLPGVVLLTFGVFPTRRIVSPLDETVLLAVSIGIALGVVPGTNNGWLNLMHGLWLALPAGAALTCRMADRISPALGRTVRQYRMALLLTLAAISLGLRCLNPYRDSRQRWQLVATVESARLKGIHTTRERARSVSDLCHELARQVRPGDAVLAFGHLPMVHYLSDTRPALEHPWPELMNTATLRERLQKWLDRDALSTVCAVEAMTNMRERHWGTERAVPSPPEDEPKRRWIQDALRAAGFRPVWQNRDFVVWKRSEGD